MKTTIRLALASAVALIAISALGQAAGGPGGRGPGGGPRAAGARLYDTQTVTTVRGEVTAVSPTGSMGLGIHLELKTADETVSVHVGPVWFLQSEGFAISAGDRLVVTGSRITFDGKPAIIARTLEEGSRTLVLRDPQGLPVWAGRGGGRRF